MRSCLNMATSLCKATTIHTMRELAHCWSTALPGWINTRVGPGWHAQYTSARKGWLWVAHHHNTKHSNTVQKHGKHGSGAKSTGDESLLCYGGPRNECAVWNVGFSDGYRRRSGMRKPWRLWCVNGVSRGDEIRRNQLMWKSSCLNVRVGERDDKSVMHRQRQGTLPRLGGKVIERSSHKARLTELNTSDETFPKDDHHLHFDSDGWQIDWRKLIHQRSSWKLV